MTSLPALREAVAKMTPGPWECVATGFHGDELHIGPPDKPAVVRNIPRADAAGIVALRNAAPALLDELETLRQRVNEDNEVCLCGCPPDAHECYEEGGESCENETHTCLRVCRSVAAEFEASQKALSAERIENAHLREAFVTMERAANQHETDLIAERALLAHCSVVLAERTVERDAARAALEEAEAGIDAQHAEITAMQQECDRRAAETGLYCREKALRDRADEAEAKAAQYQIDWMAAKHEFGDAVAKLRADLVAMTAKRDAIFEEATATGRDLAAARAVLETARDLPEDGPAPQWLIQVDRAAWLAWQARQT